MRALPSRGANNSSARFDDGSPVSYTPAVHRALVVWLALVVASATGQSSALHVHAAADQLAAEHHHGLAAHEHQRASTLHDVDDTVPHVEAEDTDLHIVSVAMGMAQVSPIDAIDVPCDLTCAFEPPASAGVLQPLTDVRVHGPPLFDRSAPRAPPLPLSA